MSQDNDLSARGHDAYIAGEGLLHASPFGLVKEAEDHPMNIP